MRKIKFALAIGMLTLALSMGVTYPASREISRTIQGSVTLNVLPIQFSADVDGSGLVDHRDLMAVAGALNSPASENIRQDINHDGVVDAIDLALVGRYFGQKVKP